MRVGIVIPARNEEEHIRNTLDSILSQTLKPSKVVVVDDCSRDRTGIIAREKGAYVVRYEKEHPSWAGKPELSIIFNLSVKTLEKILPVWIT